MTIKQAITRADLDRRNDISEIEKVGFLSELDLKIKNAVLDHYTDSGIFGEFKGYDIENPKTELLVQEPYTDIYLYWLRAKVALLDGDLEQYNNWNGLFQSAYSNFFNYYHKTHTRKRSGNFKF